MSAAPVGDPTFATRLVTTFSAIAAQAGLLSALLYYFGRTRTRSTAGVVGLDPSLFGYSTQEYVLRSVDSMVVPIGIGLVLVAATIILFELAAGTATRHTGPLNGPRRITVVALLVGVTSAGLGAAVSLGLPTWQPAVTGPLATLVGAALVGLALALSRRLGIDLPLSPVTRSERAWRAASVLLAGLVVVAMFALTAAYAEVVGRRRAVDFLNSFEARADAIVVSPVPLNLAAYPGVKVRRLDEFPDDDHPRPHYRYSGLKLLAKAGGTYYLIPAPLDRRMP